MNKILLILFLIISFRKINAQPILLQNEIALKQTGATYITNNILNNCSNINVQLQCIKHSPKAHHLTFDVYANNILVFGEVIKLNISKAGELLYISNNIKNMQALSHTNYFETPLSLNEKKCYYFKNDTYTNAIITTTTNKYLVKNEIQSLNNEILFSYNNAHNLIDTIINSKVFNPDPLTKTHNNYGGTFVDNNGADASWLTNARTNVTIPASFDAVTNTFVLENKYALIVDQAAPTVPPVTQPSKDFFYTRGQSGFADCNALYHVSTFHKYFDSLGFSTILPMQVLIDTHGQNGADNSTFYGGSTPFLEMGTGGVDDAEDADVLIHEYTHGISWSANNNFMGTDERNALDEGTADYFATSYCKNIDTFRWADMFTWDGHNTFWDGRSANYFDTYLNKNTIGDYELGSLWNTALMRIWDKIGRTTLDKLVLQSMYSWTDNNTMTNAAALILQADSMYYNKAHMGEICEGFRSKDVNPDWGCWALNNRSVETPKLDIYNTQNFANNLGPISIYCNQDSYNIAVFNIQGQQVFTKKCFDYLTYLHPSLVASNNIYFLKIYNNNFSKTFKIIKY
jgi:hypothetical protein